MRRRLSVSAIVVTALCISGALLLFSCAPSRPLTTQEKAADAAKWIAGPDNGPD